MLKKLPLLTAILCCGSLFFSQKSAAQINYSQDFETTDGSSSSVDFEIDPDGYGCTVSSLWVNLWTYDSYEKSFVSENVGFSNGQPITFTYDYKLVDYSDFTAYPNDPDWGYVTLWYGTSPTGPWTTVETINSLNHVESDACVAHTVTFTPAPGTLYYKFTARVNDNSDYIDALYFIDNISITQNASPACTGSPAESAVTGVVGCIGSAVSLTLQPYYTSSGLTYQWQSSTDGQTFADIANGTSATYETTATTNSVWYRAIVTCTDSGFTAVAAPKEVASSFVCYCIPEFTSDIEPITSVEFAGMSNTSSAVVNGSSALEDFRGVVEPAQVTAGQTYTITLQGNTAGAWTDYFTVFFDYNADGDFDDEGEKIDLDQTINDSTGDDGQSVSGDITIPATAVDGQTTFRVFKRFLDNPDDACGSYGYGQAEDYLAVIENTSNVGGFDKTKFNYSPNPVNDVLNLSYTTNIESVSVVNLLGQTVLIKSAINAVTTSVNMSSLQAGAYLVKATDDKGASVTVKVMKK